MGVVIEKTDIKRWHPKFKIEEIPEIPCANLPEPEKQKIYTAKEMLNFTIFNEGKVRDVLESISTIEDKNKQKISTEKESTENINNTFDSPVKFVPKSFLERIRAKERRLNEKAMLKDPNHEITLSKIEKIPDIMRCSYKYCFCLIVIL